MKRIFVPPPQFCVQIWNCKLHKNSSGLQIKYFQGMQTSIPGRNEYNFRGYNSTHVEQIDSTKRKNAAEELKESSMNMVTNPNFYIKQSHFLLI